ncbi:MAG TPA: FUSC family protein [Candidatus Udaeobacter sp.]
MKLWNWDPENLPSVIHSIRTAIAATMSLAIGRVFGLPEAYWAAIATLVVMQSTLGATILISIERVVATALGALAGALLATWFTQNPFVFAAAVFVLGLLCTALRMERSAYRYASVTLAIILLIPRSSAAWIIALHRFFEVSVGIVVALALAALWPEHQRESTKQNGE